MTEERRPILRQGTLDALDEIAPETIKTVAPEATDLPRETLDALDDYAAERAGSADAGAASQAGAYPAGRRP